MDKVGILKKLVMSIKRLALNGIIWNSIQLVVNQSFAFLIRLLLAKLLFPEQFGLIGMATVIIGFVQVLNGLGIGAALIQRKDKDLREAHYHTAFWTGVMWSVTLYLMMAFIAGPIAADFYNEPILKSLIPVLSIGILISPANLIHKAQLTKKMDFKRMALIDNVANIISGSLSLILAYLGFGVWALAFNSVSLVVIALPLYFRATQFWPKLIWDKQSFKDVFGFGVYTTGTSVANYLVNNVDYLLVGKLMGAQALGAYTFAFMITDTFRSRLMAVINNVMYPVYGKIQGNPGALKRYYLKVVNYNSIIIYPIMVFLVALGRPFTLHVFGAKWNDAIVPLQLLAVAVMIHMLVNSNTALIRGMGRPGLEMKLQVFKAAIFIPMLIGGIYFYGIIGAAWAVLINKVIVVMIAQYTFNKLLNIRVTVIEFFLAIRGPWFGSLIAYAVTFISFNLFHLHYIICGILLFISYSLCIWLLVGAEIKQIFLQFKLSKK
jgi:teichuronic acid exporter